MSFQREVNLMRVISIRRLREFWADHPDAEMPLRAWYHRSLKASWNTPADIKADDADASFLGNNRVVFNIKGNTYRLIVKITYQFGIVYVRFIGTHDEYDKID